MELKVQGHRKSLALHAVHMSFQQVLDSIAAYMLLLRQSAKTTFKEEQEFDLPVDEINMDMPSGSVLERAEDRSLDDGHLF